MAFGSARAEAEIECVCSVQHSCEQVLGKIHSSFTGVNPNGLRFLNVPLLQHNSVPAI